MNEPLVWLDSGWADDRSVHLLDFPFQFPPTALVDYYRTINYASMYAVYQDAVASSRLCNAVTWPDRSTGRGTMRLRDRLHCATTEYLVLEARRDHILMDAMNEIYRRQKRELMRPLKVRIVGEEGIDHGGVQQEFFRVAMAEALNPDYGMSHVLRVLAVPIDQAKYLLLRCVHNRSYDPNVMVPSLFTRARVQVRIAGHFSLTCITQRSHPSIHFPTRYV